MSKYLSIFILGIAALLGGCVAMPQPVYRGEVVVRTTSGPYYYPSTVYVPGSYSGGNYGGDSRIRIKEDEQGLLSFRVSESGLHEQEVKWILGRIEDLKARCQSGGEMKRYEIESVERAYAYAPSRSTRGDTSVRIEYVCKRGAAGGTSERSLVSPDKPLPKLGTPRL